MSYAIPEEGFVQWKFNDFEKKIKKTECNDLPSAMCRQYGVWAYFTYQYRYVWAKYEQMHCEYGFHIERILEEVTTWVCVYYNGNWKHLSDTRHESIWQREKKMKMGIGRFEHFGKIKISAFRLEC